MKTNIIYAALVVFVVSCNKDKPCEDNGLPCLTTTGKNTFGCLIDGNPFVAGVKFTVGGPVALSGSYEEDTKLLSIQADKEGSNGNITVVRFMAYINSATEANEMLVSSSTYKGYVDYSGVTCNYFHNPIDKGSVQIVHLDLDENVISGIFEMTLINSDCADSVMNITSGRFDFGY